jgi:hypothetical protein
VRHPEGPRFHQWAEGAREDLLWLYDEIARSFAMLTSSSVAGLRGEGIPHPPQPIPQA